MYGISFMHGKTLGELAQQVNGRVIGDPDIVISSAATLEQAGPGDISFLANKKYQKHLQTTKAAAVIVAKETPQAAVPLLVAEDPYYAFTQVLVILHGHRKHRNVGISAKASIADTARLGSDCHIHDFAVIEQNVRVGDRCRIYPGCYIGRGVHIGDDCIIYPSVTVYEGCKIGSRVILNANSTIGQDGFGYATHNATHHKIPQIGTVVIEDDVEIGAGCAIERGTLDQTIIGEGSKLGDLVAVGHGAKIGAHCLLVAQVGIAGSATLGHHCVVGGQAGIVGHITIGDNVTIGAQAGVINNVPDGKIIFGAPAIEAGLARRAYSTIQYLPEMRQTIRDMQNKLERNSAPPGENHDNAGGE